MLNLNCAINRTSYGIVGYNVCASLKALGIDYTLYRIDPNNSHWEADNVLESSFGGCKRNITFPTIKIWHQSDLINFPATKGAKIGFPIFELDEFSAKEKLNIFYPDGIFVTTKWAQSLISSIGVKSEVVNLGVDLAVFSPGKRGTGPYSFLSIGKLEHRKSHTELIQSFNSAFNPSDDVLLYLMVDNIFVPEMVTEFKRWAKSTKMGSKIHFISIGMPTKKLVEIINRCHCYISASKAEGWDLPVLEAMACGLQVIATDYSSHTEYCNDKNCFQLKHTGKEIARDNVFFKSEIGSWATYNYSDLTDLMNLVYKRDLKDLNVEGIKTAQEFSWNKTASKMIECCSSF